MPIHTSLWTVDKQPTEIPTSGLTSEQLLEDMIVAAPPILSEEWMLVGRQEDTAFGGRIDLLALAPDGSLVLIELKRQKTPRDIVAQALDYASWVETLKPEDLAAIYHRFAPNRSLAVDFRARFGTDLDEDSLNHSHQIILVASSLDASTERIVQYLSGRDVPINVLCFQVFQLQDTQLLGRSWLLDPVQTQTAASASLQGQSEPWNGEYYCSFGEGETRSWDDARDYGFISGGGGTWYIKTLHLLAPNDRVWVKVPGRGFVGVGIVMGRAQSASEFKVRVGTADVPILEAPRKADYGAQLASDVAKCEYFVPVKWLQTVALAEAVNEVGLFGNQNTVCKPTTGKWRTTVDRLKQAFPAYSVSGA